MEQKILVLFDGYCILCNTAVFTLNKHLDKSKYTFLPSQSEEGKEIIEKFKLGRITEDSVAVVDKDKVIIRSAAIMFLLKDMPLHWRIFRLFNFLPSSILDWFYDIIAKNRHLLFRKKSEGTACHHDIEQN
jgi:predicted DCC family thiol-disulfide oxidoreductase YuxK